VSSQVDFSNPSMQETTSVTPLFACDKRGDEANSASCLEEVPGPGWLELKGHRPQSEPLIAISHQLSCGSASRCVLRTLRYLSIRSNSCMVRMDMCQMSTFKLSCQRPCQLQHQRQLLLPNLAIRAPVCQCSRATSSGLTLS
jgi:hypothetical protein